MKILLMNLLVMLKNIFKKFNKIFFEFLIILLYFFIINNFLGTTDKTIKSDGFGYYDYLPSIFYYHDINRHNKTINSDSNIYERINNYDFYVVVENFKVNKYPCGTALLQSPFFIYNLLIFSQDNETQTPYKSPFQKSIFHSALFYLLLTLFFFRKLLLLFNIKYYIIILLQILLLFATNVFYYAHYEASFSHIYSLFAITAFVYFAKKYFLNFNIKDFLLASTFLGLILLIRQINIIIILFIPFVANNSENLTKGIQFLLKKYWIFLLGILIIISICSLQFLLWYLQTGKIIIYSYKGESFNFLEPHFFNILFSFKKGLFIYTPIIFIATISVFGFLKNKLYYLFTSWVLFFIILTYILSSWWSWFYGCSYGMRVYIDFYIVFFIAFAIFLNNISKKLKITIIIISFFTIPLNIIQTYQYANYILDWVNMDKNKYFSVFLKTDNIYKGIFFKKIYNFDNYELMKNIYIGNILIEKNKKNNTYNFTTKEIEKFEKVKIIQLSFENEFSEKNNCKILLTIDDSKTNNNLYWHSPYLLHFYEQKTNFAHRGLYNYEINTIDNLENIIKIDFTDINTSTILKNAELKFFKVKN